MKGEENQGGGACSFPKTFPIARMELRKLPTSGLVVKKEQGGEKKKDNPQTFYTNLGPQAWTLDVKCKL